MHGDEDNGQTSAWYFLHWDFTRFVPSTDQYVLGALAVRKITLQLQNGKQFVINAPGTMPAIVMFSQYYLEKAGVKLIKYATPQQGGSMQVNMGAAPNKIRVPARKIFLSALHRLNKF